MIEVKRTVRPTPTERVEFRDSDNKKILVIKPSESKPHKVTLYTSGLPNSKLQFTSKEAVAFARYLVMLAAQVNGTGLANAMVEATINELENLEECL